MQKKVLASPFEDEHQSYGHYGLISMTGIRRTLSTNAKWENPKGDSGRTQKRRWRVHTRNTPTRQRNKKTQPQPGLDGWNG